MYTGNFFEISEEQKQMVAEWYEKLPHAEVGAIGGRLIYSFTQTGLGAMLIVEDGVTGEKIDVTEYSRW